MKAFSLILLSSILFIQTNSNDFLVTAQLLKAPNKEEILIKIEAKNISNKTIKISKNLIQYYKWDREENHYGNYIAEIEKYENGEYSIFSPSADIGLVPLRNEKYISLQNGESITDTFQIDGNLFSRYKEHGEGFPAGIYRLRVCFNPSWMGQEKKESYSKWIEFKIE